MMGIRCHRPAKISPGAFGSHHCRAGGGDGTPPVSSPPICPRSCPVLLRSLHREFSMRYVFVALLFAAMPGLAFAQPLPFEDAISRAEAAPSVQARSLDSGEGRRLGQEVGSKVR